MGEVVDIKINEGKEDGLVYATEPGKDGACFEIVGVCNSEYRVDILDCEDTPESVDVSGAIIPKEDFKELCIAWLAINYPDVLRIDEDGK